MSQENFFSLSDLSGGIPRQLADGLSTHIFVGEHAMLSVVNIDPNAVGDSHSHAEEQWGFLLKGSGTRIQGDQEVSVASGDFWRTPGGVTHCFKGGPEGATVLDVFSPPRAEYKKAGSGFGSG